MTKVIFKKLNRPGLFGINRKELDQIYSDYNQLYNNYNEVYSNYTKLFSNYEHLNEMFEKQSETMSRLVNGMSVAAEREFPRQLNDIHLPYVSQDSQVKWVSRFLQKQGRRPRVLHIGNVANNAYSNTKLFHRAGIEADVICNDFYHVMGCPEWEDADFEGDLSNQFFPDWSQVDLKAFERPRWFAQGPLLPCIYYLTNRSRRRPLSASLWWCEMAYHRKLLSENGGQENSVGPLLPGFIERDNYDFDRRVQELLRIFNERFLNWKGGKLTAEDLDPWRWAMPYWRQLIKQYDVIQAYGTEPIVAMLADVPYFAFEHGTLREIPYQKTNIGRATALAYALAQHVFVTNGDCVEHAKRLAGQRYTFINHPHDENHGQHVRGAEQLRIELCKTVDADFLFFFPTRHDWVDGGTWGNKANDVFLRAFCRLREEGFRVGMVCCLWGNNVKESMDLIDQRNCTDFVRWVQPQGIIAFTRMVKACDIVVDQFYIGAFGGVFFKSMSVGGVLCSYLNEEEMIKRYGTPPPLINCRTEEEIVKKIRETISNPEILKNISRLSREWIVKYHSCNDTIRRQLTQYQKFLSEERPSL